MPVKPLLVEIKQQLYKNYYTYNIYKKKPKKQNTEPWMMQAAFNRC